jgi:hypothetical protein
MSGVTAPQQLPPQPLAGPDNTAPDNTASTATAAPAPITAGISATPAAAGPAAAAVPPAAPLPLPASKEPAVPASDFVEGSVGFSVVGGASTRPVNIDRSAKPDQSGHYSTQAVTGRVDFHLHATDLFAGAALKLSAVSVPGASSGTATAEVGVKHPVGPGSVGVSVAGYDNVAVHVNRDDPKNFDPNYENLQAAVFGDIPMKLPHGFKLTGHGEGGFRDGKDDVKRLNSVAQVSAEKQVGPVTAQAKAAVTVGVWTHAHGRVDEIPSAEVSGSVPIADNLKFVLGVNARGRNSNTPGRNLFDAGVFGAVQGNLPFSSKPKPKR